MVQKVVVARVRIEGTHYWPDAPAEVFWLRSTHHHTFHIAAYKRVSHDDREVEFLTLGHEIEAWMEKNYGQPVCTLNAMSCEAIAHALLDEFKLEMCEVLEDGRHGAQVIAL